MSITRRKALRIVLGTGATVLGAGAVGLVVLDRIVNPHTPLDYPFPNTSNLLMPTADCRDTDDLTDELTEGPFYTPHTPERVVLRERDSVGTPLLIHGRVLTHDCRPVAGAVLDFWSCDGNGVYDNDGFRLRGHQYTSSDGAYRVETVRPKDYAQWGVHRTAHVHVKVQGRGTRLLTTQLFFPNEPRNAKDMFFKDSLLLGLTRSADALVARFDFVL